MDGLDCLHTEFAWHGWPHSPVARTALSQRPPFQEAAQLHLYEEVWSWHVPPFWHGADAHSLMSAPQVPPLNPAAHLHVNFAAPSTQVAPFLHGPDAHSLMSVSQRVP